MFISRDRRVPARAQRHSTSRRATRLCGGASCWRSITWPSPSGATALVYEVLWTRQFVSLRRDHACHLGDARGHLPRPRNGERRRRPALCTLAEAVYPDTFGTRGLWLFLVGPLDPADPEFAQTRRNREREPWIELLGPTTQLHSMRPLSSPFVGEELYGPLPRFRTRVCVEVSPRANSGKHTP